ncbi:hypothetical protein [Aurantiacibacter marinus]|uniref:Uncharacterized protein n=1 Tax=Aurantiacibacter marinus TaxID=874156 RepID=A0A0H0XJS7_9SPHN|nr:hypothetical protein [Aurantiacibacter marinus]KLI62818.1 hypothetical protein AAV99_12060 [Aurantiacibacter marinus]
MVLLVSDRRDFFDILKDVPMKITETASKAAWCTPAIVDLDQDAEDVKNGLQAGTDGNAGLSMLSAS